MADSKGKPIPQWLQSLIERTTDEFRKGMSPEDWARWAISNGKTMGQFVRDLPQSDRMPKEQLELYTKAYAKVRAEKSHNAPEIHS